MPLLSTVGRRSPAHRAVVMVIYCLLGLGSLTMLYPFAVMLASSTANQYDYHDFSPLPRFLWDDDALLLKTLYLREGGLAASKYGLPAATLEQVKADPRSNVQRAMGAVMQRARENPQGLALQVADWREFLQTLPIAYIELHSRDRYMAQFPNFVERVYRSKAPHNDVTEALTLYNRDTQEQHDTFATVAFWGGQGYPFQRFQPEPGVQFDLVQAFKKHMGSGYFSFTPTHALWQFMLQQKYADVHAINAAWGTEYGELSQIEFPSTLPEKPVMAQDWRTFVTTRLPLLQQSIGPEWTQKFREFVSKRYPTPHDYRKALGDDAPPIEELTLPMSLPASGPMANLWAEFLTQSVPAEQRVLQIPSVQYQRFLQDKYGSIAQAGRAYGLPWNDATVPALPFAEDLVHDVTTQSAALRWYFLTGNYVRVMQYVVTRGRALLNTVVLVALTVFSALTINPLAAYALSRYRMKSGPKVLLFMLATMAFPAEVAMIPTFLLMRDLGLLNTFAALIVPGMANGFSIFLLKGFFDSLPRELYEAADLDGAGEVRKFLTITLPLSKPILAVIALGSFSYAYTSFMWGLVICPDPKMWTIMVWLFAFQGTHGATAPYLVMASFVVASIPPLLMFIICQRAILRGIMIPEMK